MILLNDKVIPYNTKNLKYTKVERGNIYEDFRILGEAVLLSKGIKSFDHKAMIEELIKLDNDAHLLFLNTIKEIRHKINHKGYSSAITEAKDAIDFAEKHFNDIYEKVKNEIENFSI